MSAAPVTLLFMAVGLLVSVTVVEAALAENYYRGKCPNKVDAEAVITKAVQSAFSQNRATMPGVLRMHFHDCFVNVSS